MTDEVAHRTVRVALDSDINLFDTADNYGPLLGEGRLCKALGAGCAPMD